jgi:hypothetical protein
VLDAFLSLLVAPDLQLVSTALRFVEAVLSDYPHGPALVEEGGGIDALEGLQYSREHDRAPELQQKAADLVEQYFGADYEGDGDGDGDMPAPEGEAPDGGGFFAFAPPAPPPAGGFNFGPAGAGAGAAPPPGAGRGRGSHLTKPAWMQ